jgi:hypothetical protein
LSTDAAEAEKKKAVQKARALLDKSSDSEDYFIRDGQDDTDDDEGQVRNCSRLGRQTPWLSFTSFNRMMPASRTMKKRMTIKTTRTTLKRRTVRMPRSHRPKVAGRRTARLRLCTSRWSTVLVTLYERYLLPLGVLMRNVEVVHVLRNLIC